MCILCRGEESYQEDNYVLQEQDDINIRMLVLVDGVLHHFSRPLSEVEFF